MTRVKYFVADFTANIALLFWVTIVALVVTVVAS
jgi:hypothetical protein